MCELISSTAPPSVSARAPARESPNPSAIVFCVLRLNSRPSPNALTPDVHPQDGTSAEFLAFEEMRLQKQADGLYAKPGGEVTYAREVWWLSTILADLFRWFYGSDSSMFMVS